MADCLEAPGSSSTFPPSSESSLPLLPHLCSPASSQLSHPRLISLLLCLSSLCLQVIAASQPCLHLSSLVSSLTLSSALPASPQLSQPLLSSLSLSSALSAFLQPRLYGIYLSSYLFSLVSTTLSSLVSQPLSSLVSQPLSPALSLPLQPPLQPCLYSPASSHHLSSLNALQPHLQPCLTTSPAFILVHTESNSIVNYVAVNN